MMLGVKRFCFQISGPFEDNHVIDFEFRISRKIFSTHTYSATPLQEHLSVQKRKLV